MRDHGLRVRLYDSVGYIDEYDTPVPASPSGITEEPPAVLVSRPPGREFTVEIDLRDFHLHSASGVTVIIACGHGPQPPGGFEHVQYYWIEAKDMKTHAFDFASYDTWEDDCAADTVETPYTMPPRRRDLGDDDLTPTSMEPFNATNGSVAVYVLRGHVVNDPYRDLSKRPERPLTDPPATRMGIFQDSPVTIARNWFAKLVRSNGRPYVFKYINLADEDLGRADCRLRSNDMTPDHDDADTEEENPHQYGPEDSDGPYQSGDSDGNSSATASDTDTIGSFWDRINTESDLATNLPLPTEPTRKRRRVSEDASESRRQLRRRRQASHSKIHDMDEDDEEGLPTKTESPQSTTALNVAVTTLTASQAPRQVTPRGLAPRLATVVTQAMDEYEEEDLYGDSRHPSLYNEPATEQRNVEPPATTDAHDDQPNGRVGQDEHFGTGSSRRRRRRATLLQLGCPPTPIDLTLDGSDDPAQVKDEVVEPQDSLERNPASTTAEDVTSDDEGGLKILAEEIRLKREDVRLQMEQLELRKRLRALEKKRGQPGR
ncbi:hypothetical protein LTR56_006191 [Elasticomyces elasticus]|nr:hypothetical protein LTR56_006191 [Elasticomyces elasticus]KAK3666600.1 hypothetical protein LTR22_002544 [Elasticomyces elasticus]KAK4928267.1 hypothetical protein LTR49_004944 [Elasticomyces elasticus]KAK5763830.1 hypothetical protein LTS12_005948 [Elasticomyces elasticus]